MRVKADGRTGGRADRPVPPEAGVLDAGPSCVEEPPSPDPPVRPSPWERRGTLWLRVRQQIETCAADFRRVVGMPDYQAYVRHLRLCHPDSPVPSEREFFNLYVTARYGDGPTRCC